MRITLLNGGVWASYFQYRRLFYAKKTMQSDAAKSLLSFLPADRARFHGVHSGGTRLPIAKKVFLDRLFLELFAEILVNQMIDRKIRWRIPPHSYTKKHALKLSVCQVNTFDDCYFCSVITPRDSITRSRPCRA